MTQLALLDTLRAEQLPLALGVARAPGRDDVIETPAVAAGVRLLDAWPLWPSHAVLLSGPSGSGKSHLASVWAGEAGAARLEGGALAGLDPLPHAGRPVLIEHADIALAGERPRAAQAGLFHLLNLLRQTGGSALLTARTPLPAWPLAIPDLASRLRAATHVALGPPDETLVEAVLCKLFADRQLERSLTAARRLVDRVDRIALSERRPIDARTLRRALAGL